MQPETIKLQGGTLSLDFANSADWTAGGEPIEAEDALLEPDSLVRWGRRLRVLAGGDDRRSPADAGSPAGGRSPADAGLPAGGEVPPGRDRSVATATRPAGRDVAGGREAVAAELAAARALRPALRGVLAAAAQGETPDPSALDLLTRTYAEATAAARLSPRDDGGYVLDWPDEDPRKVRFAVVADAIALLADSSRLRRVHVCPGRNCGWLFLNKSGRQRWCSMATCGSRAKMRAMYARRLQER